MGLAEKTTEAHKTAKYWIQKYLSSESNTNYPSDINKLTYEYLEEENMQIFMEMVGLWLSTGRFWTRQNTFLGNDVKATYFKNMKELLKSTFPHHYLFQPYYPSDWFSEMLKRFEKECQRNRLEDPEVSDERKSEPLYRDLCSSDIGVRAKYLPLLPVDARGVAMRMLRNIGANIDKNVKLFVEFILNRVAISRSGEHAWVRWNEATYDHRFKAPDFDWTMIKQVEKQPMLLFCDLTLYCLCPFFAFGVFFLFGYLQRDGVSEAKKDFVFWYLHHLHKDTIAARITDHLRANIDTGNLSAYCWWDYG
jgi:hypothetical protein